MAFAVVNAVDSESGETVKDLEAYHACFVERDSPLEVRTFPCAEPFPLPEGDFLFWVEGPGRISSLMILRSRGAPGQTVPHRFTVSVRPAGTVVAAIQGLEELSPRAGDLELRLLQARPILDGKLTREFARRIPFTESMHPHQMPEGPVIAAIFDHVHNRYERLSRPVNADHERSTTVNLTAPPQDRAALVARIERFAPVVDPAGDDVEVKLQRPDGSALKPDRLVRSAARLYAFWFDLGPGPVTVGVSSPSAWGAPAAVQLEGGEIADLSIQLQPPAALHAQIVLPPGVSEAGGRLVVRSRDRRRLYRTVDLSSGIPGELTITGLPRAPVLVELDFGPWRAFQEADLTGGEGSVFLAPDFVHITGDVTVEDQGASATLRFLTLKAGPGKEIAAEVATDDEGEFEADLIGDQLQPIVLVSVGGREPLWWNIEPPLRDGDEIHIDLKGRALDLRVVDARTHRGIGDAEVWYGWGGDRAGGRMARTDDDGVVRLPPVPEEELKLGIRAKGYVAASRRIRPKAVVTEPVEVPLEPEEGETVTFLLPSGAPAAGASVAILPGGSAPPRWTGQADANGRLSVPQMRGGEILVVRHPRSGLLLTGTAPTRGEGGATLTLPQPGGVLRGKVVEPGGKPAAFALATVWVGGVRLTGGALQWVLQAPIMSLQDGSWEARTVLAPQPVALLFCERSGDPSRDAACSSGELDYRRENIPFPWPAELTLEAVTP